MKKPDYKALAKSKVEECISSLKTLVSFNSIYDNKTADGSNPFGKEVTNCLKAFEEMARKDGFKAINYNNMIVEVEIGNEGEDVTILGHLDVVPAVGSWESSPFNCIIKGDQLIGRGVSDDKGPLLASYYAAKTLYERGLMKGYHVRILAGGNEETGSRGVHYYFDELLKPQPTIGFSPDADFPLVFAEKCIHFYEASGNLELEDVLTISGGVASNAVIDSVVLTTKSKDLITFLSSTLPDSEYKMVSDIYKFTAYGKSAHGSTPEKGINAGILLLKALYLRNKDSKLLDIIEAFGNPTPEGLGITHISPTMGNNSLNIGFIEYSSNNIKLVCDMRTVDGISKNVAKDAIIKNSPLTIKYRGCSPLLYKDLDSPLVKGLLEAYQEETGDKETKPIALGGATYAKSCDNILAYGMEFPGYDSNMHGANEHIDIKNLILGMAIYMNAISKLGDIIK